METSKLPGMPEIKFKLQKIYLFLQFGVPISISYYPPTLEACWSAPYRTILTGESKLNDCKCHPCPQNEPIVDIDLQTRSRRHMSLRFVNFIPDPYGAFLYWGGGEPHGKLRPLPRIRNLAIIAHQLVCLSACPLVGLSACLLVCLSACLLACLFACLLVSLFA